MGILVMLVATESEHQQPQDSWRGNFNRALSSLSPGTTSPCCLALAGLSTVTQCTQQSIDSNRNHLEKSLCMEEGRSRSSSGQGRT